MILRRYVLALAALALSVGLAAPAVADQTFWTFSTAPVASPKPRATYGVNIDYVYYPCPQVVGTPDRFNPWDPRSTSGPQMYPGTPNFSYGCNSGHHHQPKPFPPGRRFPLAKPT